MSEIDPPVVIPAIARAAAAVGGRAFAVGGWVRDRLRGDASKDIDIEVFGVPETELPPLLERFGRVEAVGRSFAVYKLVPPDGGFGEIDVALPRRESKIGRGHRAFEVHGDPTLSIAEAARRRDFTINAIYWDPLTGDYHDPYGGRADLDQGLLRAVDPARFGDDSLRVLRALQFAGRFALTLEPATAALCRRIALDDLPAERIWGEMEKLLRAARPSIGLAMALDLGVVDALWPELRLLVDCPQEPEWHPEGDVWTHTLMVADVARAQNGDLDRARLATVMLGALCHDLGKPATTALIDGRIRSLNHEEAGVAPTLRLLDRLNVHTIDGFGVRSATVGLVAHHLKPGMLFKAGRVTDGAFRRLALKVDMELLARLARADCLGRAGRFDCGAMDWFITRARALGVDHHPPAPLLLGRHLVALGLRPGPAIGAILGQVYERQLDGDIRTLEDGIALAEALVAKREEPAEPE